jgi:signal peptidase II
MSVGALCGWAAVTVGLDQATKVAILRCIPRGGVRLAVGVWLKPVFNRRGGFITLSHLQVAGLYVLILAMLAWLNAMLPPLSPLRASGLGLVVGGAAGNMVDRFARGAVVDFIAIGRWPVFNFADAAMGVGLALTAGSLL